MERRREEEVRVILFILHFIDTVFSKEEWFTFTSSSCKLFNFSPLLPLLLLRRDEVVTINFLRQSSALGAGMPLRFVAPELLRRNSYDAA